MTEAEKVIISFKELLENNDSVLTPIVKQIEQMKEELSRLSSDKEKAMLIQEYCKPHLELKKTLKAMAARANLKGLKTFIQSQQAHRETQLPSQLSDDLERVMNKFLIDVKDKDNQETQSTSSEDIEQKGSDND